MGKRCGGSPGKETRGGEHTIHAGSSSVFQPPTPFKQIPDALCSRWKNTHPAGGEKESMGVKERPLSHTPCPSSDLTQSIGLHKRDEEDSGGVDRQGWKWPKSPLPQDNECGDGCGDSEPPCLLQISVRPKGPHSESKMKGLSKGFS